jgi:uncharacterized protein (TIGR02246 family)
MQLKEWMAGGIVTAALMANGCGAGVRAAETPQVVVEQMLTAEQTAWNASDSVSYANEYTDDADFINIRGQVFTGKTAVQRQHAMIFAGPFKGSTIQIELRKLTEVGAGAVLVDTDQTVTNFKGLPPGVVATSAGTLITHFKYLAVRQEDGTWKFSSGQNTAVLPNPPASSALQSY